MITWKKLGVAVIGLFCLGIADVGADDPKDRGFLDRVYKDSAGTEAKYVLYVPHDYKAEKAFPLILFLHGAGETGTDGSRGFPSIHGVSRRGAQ